MKISTLLSVFMFMFHGVIFTQQFSLEDVLSAPYTSNLTASDDGSKIAWVSELKGSRQVYVAESPGFEGREVFSTGSDDGQVLGNLQFDHSGRLLYFIKGSGPNRQGEVANPASLVNYPKQILYSYNLSTDVLDDLGSHAVYHISPDDSFLLLPKGNNLARMEVRTEVVEPLITMRGTFSDLAFSPDSTSIVFTSNRGDHSFIGMFTFGSDRIQWLSPSVDKDQSPQWSADGRQVAFIRMPGDRKGDLNDITSGSPFSIIIHDLATDASTAIWESPADDGGFAQYYPSRPLRWSKKERLLFYSEHEGWMKIYSILPDGSGIRPVIDGSCEVEHSDMNFEGDQLIFSSNCRDLNDRDIYLHNISEGTTKALSSSSSLETDPVLFNGSHYAFRRAWYNQMPAIVVGDQTVYPRDLPMSFPKQHLIKPLNVQFQAADGTVVHGQLFVKDRINPKPGLLFLHGGPIRQMLPGFHYSSYYAFAYAMNQYLADRGYVVLSVNFRAGIGYGRDFRRAPNQGPRGASEYQDVVAGARYLQSLEYVNKDKIGLWGGSYGGLLTAQGLALNSDIFKAGVDFHGVHDWSWRAVDFSKGGFWGISPDLMEMAFESSPAGQMSEWTSPVLFIHGDDDRNVMFGQTIDLVERLREKNVHHEILVLPDEVHGFYRWESWVKSYLATADFFDRYLK